MTRRILAAIAAASWLAGCVSILGVDPEDHEDVAEIVCACSNARRSTCAAAVGAVLEARPELEEIVVGCAADFDQCGELDACLEEARICSDEGGNCTPDDAEGRVNLRCCEPLQCDPESGRCAAAACVGGGASCATAACCEGLGCNDGLCCNVEGGRCASNTDCCDGGFCTGEDICTPCADEGTECSGSGQDGSCCGGLACLPTGFCGPALP